MKNIFIFASSIIVLFFSLNAEAYCVYNVPDSMLTISVEDVDGGVFTSFTKDIRPGKAECCPGNESSCAGRVRIYCQRDGQNMYFVGLYKIGKRGWIKIRCTRASDNEPFHGEVVEHQYKDNDFIPFID